MISATKGGREAAWFMQLDIRSFFMSIDRNILLQMLSRHVRDSRLIDLAKKIILQDCTKDFVYKGDPRLLQGIPSHKSLFHIPEGKGLPIGNLTSQFFGNVYLNELDQFVKHTLKVRYYLRYVDDFILLDQSPDVLLELKQRIADFLKERLALELKADFTLKRVSEGSNFLGYIVRPDYVLVRNRVIGNLRARLRSFEDEMVQYGITEAGRSERIHLREENVRQLRQTIASYLGHFKHANAHRLVNSLFEKYRFLKDIFTVDDDRLVPLYEPPFEPANLRGQYRWAVDRYGDSCVFFQVGSFCEFYGQQAERYGSFFSLALQPATRNLQPPMCGFPVRYLKDFKEKALQAGLSYVVVGERGYYQSGLKKRVITEILRY